VRSKFEIKAQHELEGDGWIVDWKIRPSGFKNPRGYNVDFFGLFDLMAYQPPVIRFIAIKGQGGVPAVLRKMIECFALPDQCVKEIWTYSKHTFKGKKARTFACRKEVV
jgi:hypothetical protein